MKLKFILLLVVTFSANMFLFSQSDSSTNKKPLTPAERKQRIASLKIDAQKARLESARELAKIKTADSFGRVGEGGFGYQGADSSNQNNASSSSSYNDDNYIYENPTGGHSSAVSAGKFIQNMGWVLGFILPLFFPIIIVLCYSFITRKKSAQPLKNYNEKDYNVIKEKLSEMYSDNLLTKEELEIKLANLEEKQKREKKEVELNLRKEKLYKAYKEGIITLQEYNSKLSSL